MALVTLVDALNKLKCNYVDFFIQRYELSLIDLECYGKSDNELWTIVNYWYMLNSGCYPVDCSIDSFVAQCTTTLNSIEICGDIESVSCSLTLEAIPESCENYNLYPVV